MIFFVIIIHAVICTALIGLVLIQRGRGAGLVESFSGVESIFGTKTSAFLTRATTVLSIAFFITCLSLAVLSIKQSRSLMKEIKPQQETPKTEQAPITQEPKGETPQTEQK
jgi:preprotein translocase subunit SecG